MRKFNVVVNGKAYEVDVEELGGDNTSSVSSAPVVARTHSFSFSRRRRLRKKGRQSLRARSDEDGKRYFRTRGRHDYLCR